MAKIKMSLENLLEKTGATEQDLERLRDMQIRAALRAIQLRVVITQRGGNIHGVNRKATDKRRRANKLARQSRREARR